VGCDDVIYLPFAYAPQIHFPEPPSGQSEKAEYFSDVFFAGGADNDRVALISAMLKEGFKLALYGGRWERYQEARAAWLGMADPRTIRKAASGAKVSLCIVRRANRDGHSMRSFELPAMGACMIVEDTQEHREIFGPFGEAVVYFDGCEDLLAKTRKLLDDEAERKRLATACHEKVCQGKNTYKDRLDYMLSYVTNVG
jgi:spore maturation protein CgeB